MSIYTANEIWDGRRTSLAEDNVRTYTRVFRIRTKPNQAGINNQGNIYPADSGPGFDGGYDLLVSTLNSVPIPGLPVIFSPYVDRRGNVDLGALLQRFTPRNDPEDPEMWLVDCEYSSRSANPQQANLGYVQPNPLLRPPILDWSTSKFQRAVDQSYDDDGNLAVPVMNSAGEYFEPVPEADDSRIVLKIMKNQAQMDPDTIAYYTDAVNTDQFLGLDTYQWKIDSIHPTPRFEDGFLYQECEYVLHARFETWIAYLMDRGYFYLDYTTDPTNPPVRRMMVDPHTNLPYSSPQPLNGYGQPLANTQTASTIPISGGQPPVPTVVTPVSMTGIAVGSWLTIDGHVNPEKVYVTAITSTTFSAVFTKMHNTTPVPIVGNAVFLPFNYYRPVAFADLNIP